MESMPSGNIPSKMDQLVEPPWKSPGNKSQAIVSSFGSLRGQNLGRIIYIHGLADALE